MLVRNKLSMVDIQAAMNIYNNNFLDIDDEEKPIHLADNQINIENGAVEKDMTNSISDEAKTILKIILNAPSEIVGLFSPKRKEPTRNARKAVVKYIEKKGMQPSKIMNELKMYVHSDDFNIKRWK